MDKPVPVPVPDRPPDRILHGPWEPTGEIGPDRIVWDGLFREPVLVTTFFEERRIYEVWEEPAHYAMVEDLTVPQVDWTQEAPSVTVDPRWKTVRIPARTLARCARVERRLQ